MSMYRIAERFKSVQGEGLFTGTPMAFIRFVGCSVGKRICQHCDTDFETEHLWHGGGTLTLEELMLWVDHDPQHPYEHVCLTGGEPLDQPDLPDLVAALTAWPERLVHIETSGTVEPSTRLVSYSEQLHWTVSPKPGFLASMIAEADEIKVIVPGLGINPPEGKHWPTPQEAVDWASHGKIVFLQPRNGKFDIDQINLKLCEELVLANPSLRLSVQVHKLLRVR